jgi:hypothetical protein
MITTTLNKIREHSPCQEGWTKLLAGLGKTAGDDELLPFAKILEINGFKDAIWCCRAEPLYDKEWRLLAVKYARRVEHLNTDPAVKNAYDVAERYANGEATDEELVFARTAAWAAWDTATKTAAWAARWAAAAAARTAEATAEATAAVAADYAADYAAAAAADAAADYAAATAARAAEREYQAQELLRVVAETEAREQ